jgi:hypothetical protein
MFIIRAPACGSQRVLPSRIGKSPVLCCGSTENVRSPALCTLTLANELYIRSRRWQKRPYVRHPLGRLC